MNGKEVLQQTREKKMRYYKLNKIYVEYDELRGNFYHWNPITRIGKKDKISERTARKLVAKILTPIFEHEFMEMFDHVMWLKTPALEYITIEGCIKI